MEQMNRWLDKFDHVLAFISGIMLFIMMSWIFLDVLLRAILNRPIVGTIEIVGEYMMVVIIYFAISYTFQQNAHVSVDFLTSKLSKGTKRVFALITNVLSLSVFIILTHSNYIKMLEYVTKNIKSVGLLNYPLAPALMVITIGLFCLSIRLIIDSINIIQNRKQFE